MTEEKIEANGAGHLEAAFGIGFQSIQRVSIVSLLTKLDFLQLNDIGS